MSQTMKSRIDEVQSGAAAGTANAPRAAMKLEVVVIPVSDVDRAKTFYGGLGWKLDGDFVVGDEFRGVQFTPPGSASSIHFGTGITSAAPGSASGLYLVVSDIEAARTELLGRGVDVSGVFHRAGPGKPPVGGRIPSAAAIPRSRLSRIRTEMNGCCRKSPPACPDGSRPATPPTPRRLSWRPRSGAHRRRMVNTRSGTAVSAMRIGRTGTPRTWWRSIPARNCLSDLQPFCTASTGRCSC